MSLLTVPEEEGGEQNRAGLECTLLAAVTDRSGR